MSNLIVANTSISQHNGFFSLTDLHKSSGGADKHKPSNFMRNQETQEMIAELEKENTVAYHVKQGKQGGTYACRELVYRYAMWISPKFSLMVIRAFDAMNTGAIPALQRHTISEHQAHAISKAVKQKCLHNSTHYQTVYTALKDEFDVPSYKELLASDFDNAMAFIANCHLKVDSCLHNDAIARNLHNLVWHTMHIYQWYKERENAFFALSPTIAGGVHDHIIHAKGCANALQRAFDGDYSKRLI